MRLTTILILKKEKKKKKATLIKSENMLLRQTWLESALISRLFTINLLSGSSVSPFLADFLLSQCRIFNKSDRSISKKKKNLNGFG